MYFVESVTVWLVVAARPALLCSALLHTLPISPHSRVGLLGECCLR